MVFHNIGEIYLEKRLQAPLSWRSQRVGTKVCVSVGNNNAMK